MVGVSDTHQDRTRTRATVSATVITVAMANGRRFLRFLVLRLRTTGIGFQTTTGSGGHVVHLAIRIIDYLSPYAGNAATSNSLACCA
jgi:hypothetical protein